MGPDMRTLARPRRTTLARPRTLEAAQDILRSEGVNDASGLGLDHADEDRLGCSLVAHREWMRRTMASELRAWAKSWVAP